MSASELRDLEVSRNPRWVMLVLVGVAGVFGLFVYGYLAKPEWIGVADKTLWDWMQLLIVPLMLAGGGILLNSRTQQYHDELVHQYEIERDETAAIQRVQDEALRAYLDQMNRLIIEEHLMEKPENSQVRRLAQAWTLQILLGLDRDRKRRPLRLIYELDLISKDNPIISLENAEFDTADLTEITLHDACLRGADLRLTNLRGADLKGSDLRAADLRGASLRAADLSDTCLAGANLLPYDEVEPSELRNANLLSGVADPNDIGPTDDPLGDPLADSLTPTQTPTQLENANLSNADLTGAYLSGADLMGAKGITNEELEQQAKSLKYATMPNGQKYEDWLKDRAPPEG
jgi:uncharacterized protein YjbI with pentapeptide repeats